MDGETSTQVELTRRALLDILEIETYSIERWGKLVAKQYLESIENALDLLRRNPNLLKTKPDVSASLCFYRVKEHFLICSVFENIIIVLTVKHGAIDLPSRIAELEPQLIIEAEMLYNAWKTQKSSK